MCLLTEHFVKFKIRHIFIMLFGGYFVKFCYRQTFWPYGIFVITESEESVNNKDILQLLWLRPIVGFLNNLTT